jgi:hypothetical protein
MVSPPRSGEKRWPKQGDPDREGRSDNDVQEGREQPQGLRTRFLGDLGQYTQ